MQAVCGHMQIAKTNKHIHSTILFFIQTQHLDSILYEVMLLNTSASDAWQQIPDLPDPMEVGVASAELLINHSIVNAGQ